MEKNPLEVIPDSADTANARDIQWTFLNISSDQTPCEKAAEILPSSAQAPTPTQLGAEFALFPV